MKNKKVPVLITIFSLAAIALISRAFAAPEQAIPLSQMLCTAIDPIPITIADHGTGEKPQSKVWSHDGNWWAVFPTDTSGASSAGTWIWKLVENQGAYSWAEVLKISTRTDTKADVKNDGNITHILLFAINSPASTELVSIEYATGTYQLWTSRPTAAAISLYSGSETATIELDSYGRMWLATKDSNDHIVYYSDSPYSSWTNTFAISSKGSSDDISVVTALPGNLIGVLWSDQDTDEFKFRLHVDGSSPTTWSSEEALAANASFADDHVNVAVATNGTLYAAVKTSYSGGTMELIVRSPTGTWYGPYNVDSEGTRPIVQLNELAGYVDVIYPIKDGGLRPMIYKETPTSSISFGGDEARLTLQSGEFNDPSSMKENYENELVTIYSGDNVATLYGSYCKASAATPEADLEVTKSDAADPVYVGYNITYSMTVKNNGPDSASNVVLTDTLPTGVNFVSAIPDQGSCSETSGEVRCELNEITNGSNVGISIVALTTLTGNLVNNVVVSSDTDDHNSANNSDSEETTVNDCTAPCGVTQEIPLALGWNLVSSYVDPQNPDIETLLAGFVNKVTIVRDGEGHVYWPSLNIDDINDWDVNSGYQILMNDTATLSITGLQVDPAQTPISLPAGWSLVAYLRDTTMPIDQALTSINGQLTVAKNNAGQIYWPAYNVNQIGGQEPAVGYQIYLSSDGTLIYPANQ